ncbi:MAG: ATP-binding protein [Candidatus Aenigmarchaeota archaeon]|nr:ATP-binding protein [Candidatus Aenigmarchaeota archaeon]
MKKIAILSGKGGVGKSTITASLAVLLSKKKKIIAVDCDIDAPNLGLVLGLRQNDYKWREISTNEKAVLIKKRCIGCKKCVHVCNFSAISWDKERPVFDEMRCEGCGACLLVCPENAIKLKKVKNAYIGVSQTHGFPIVTGKLKMGESGSGKIIIEVKNTASKVAKNADIMLIDCAAGIGCPVISSIQGSDYGAIVTEPTPSAFHDMKRSLQILDNFHIPCGIIINKYDLSRNFSRKIEQFAYKNKLSILGKLPYDKKFVEALVRLKPIVEYDEKFEKKFEKILNKIMTGIKH